jgi:deoxyribonuclease V
MSGSLNLREAARLQEKLAARLILSWAGRRVKTVAGSDVSYDLRRGLLAAAIVVCSFPGLEVLETASAVQEIPFPYRPGFLSLREAPVFLEAFGRLKSRPEVTLVDGNGIAHPRRMGLASHVGVLLDVPSVGCAKNPFFPFRTPGVRRGSATAVLDERGERVGLCLRTRDGVKPIFVSPGHRVDFALTRRLVLACSRTRLPEPQRLAHSLASAIWKNGVGPGSPV